MRRLLFLAFLLVAVPAHAQTVKWFSGLETGDFSEFATNSGCTVSTTSVFTGAYAWQCTNGGAGAFAKTATGLAAGPTVGLRFRLNPGALAGGHIQNMVQIANAGDTAFFSVFITSALKLAWGHNNNTAIATGATTLTTATFHSIAIRCVIDASVGGCQVILDGTSEFSSFGTNTSDVSSVDHVYFVVSTSAGSDVEVFDDAMVCSGAACPAGRSIARQGTSGSPTYDAWTKVGVGCSGSSIDNCWSNTPFTTTTSATSSVASDAQTMIVSSMGATQTGHGTEVIAAHDTINACKTAMIAKTASSSGASIRRRLNGTDTDTAKTLTTSDAYYDDGIWTTTTDNLRGVHVFEIGAVHGSGVNLDTVEDMWAMCDYLAGSTPTVHRVTQ